MLLFFYNNLFMMESLPEFMKSRAVVKEQFKKASRLLINLETREAIQLRINTLEGY